LLRGRKGTRLVFDYDAEEQRDSRSGDLSMKRVNVDTASPAVKKFIQSLAIDAEGVEVTLDGKVVCKIIPPGQLSDAEKTAQLGVVRQLLGEARANSMRMPATNIERNIKSALKTIRQSLSGRGDAVD
jgi:hypothetical protein